MNDPDITEKEQAQLEQIDAFIRECPWPETVNKGQISYLIYRISEIYNLSGSDLMLLAAGAARGRREDD